MGTHPGLHGQDKWLDRIFYFWKRVCEVGEIDLGGTRGGSGEWNIIKTHCTKFSKINKTFLKYKYNYNCKKIWLWLCPCVLWNKTGSWVFKSFKNTFKIQCLFYNYIIVDGKIVKVMGKWWIQTSDGHLLQTSCV